MSGLIQILKETIFDLVNILIIVIFLVDLLSLVKIFKKFKKINSELDNAYNATTTETKVNQENHSLETLTSRQLVSRNLDTVKDEYEKAGIKYRSCISFVSIFPLLGLLGTVIGLMPGLAAMNSDAGLEILYSSLSTALSTTFWGIFVAIIIKIVDSLFVSKIIGEVENKIADRDREYNSYFGQ